MLSVYRRSRVMTVQLKTFVGDGVVMAPITITLSDLYQIPGLEFRSCHPAYLMSGHWRVVKPESSFLRGTLAPLDRWHPHPLMERNKYAPTAFQTLQTQYTSIYLHSVNHLITASFRDLVYVCTSHGPPADIRIQCTEDISYPIFVQVPSIHFTTPDLSGICT